MARIIYIRGASSYEELQKNTDLHDPGALLYATSCMDHEHTQQNGCGTSIFELAGPKHGQQLPLCGMEQLCLKAPAYEANISRCTSPPLSSDETDDSQLRRTVLQGLLFPSHSLSKATAAAYDAPCIEPTSIPDADNVPTASLIRSLPTYILYDDEGLRLFDQITHLPEYYLTNAELDILQRHGQEIVAEAMPHGALVVELGAG